MKKILLTGFEPFLAFSVNPTMAVAKALDGKVFGDYQVVSRILVVDFTQSAIDFKQILAEEKPDVIISLGLAGGSYKITPERIAINCKDGDADNVGYAPQDEVILADGNAGYFSTLPIRKMVDELIANGLPASISNTAGTYLCNNIMYEGLVYAEKQPNVIAGFIHIPASHELAIEHKKIPSWSLADLIRGVETCITTII